jgi:CubicO group peptidase (beta-lactamase class C family)
VLRSASIPASNTKALTAAALAILVDEGRLGWDDPVADRLPGFRLGSDPYISSQLTVRDLLTHRSGLPLGAGDLLWLHADYPSEEIVRRLRYLEPTASFRSRYAYDNVLYIVAGEVVKAVSGRPWPDFVQSRIFTPLGMRDVSTSVTGFRPGADVASPHGRVEGRMQVVPADTVDNIVAAGGVNASIADWARWMTVQLDSGRVGGSARIWADSQTRAMWRPEIFMPVEWTLPAFAPLRPSFSAYGLGWRLRDYAGHKLVMHDGGLAGMLSRTVLVPDKRLGVAVLTNAETPAYEALAWYVLDYYLGRPRTDWTERFAAVAQQTASADRAFEDSASTARHRDSGPSLPLDRFAGRYADAWYGDVALALEGDRLVLRWSHSPALTADLEHWQYDTFRARMRGKNVPDAFVTFALAPDGSVDRMTMVPVLPSTDFSYDYQHLLFRPVRGTP